MSLLSNYGAYVFDIAVWCTILTIFFTFFSIFSKIAIIETLRLVKQSFFYLAILMYILHINMVLYSMYMRVI